MNPLDRRKLEFLARTRESLRFGSGRVLRPFPDRGYGFLQSDDGRKIYCHRNAVVDADFEDLRPGAEVVFSEEPGENGAQATIVKWPQPIRAFSRAKRASSGV